jgi:TonB family protein
MSTSDRLARSLLLYAAHSAPPALAQRLEEEWLADFETRRAGLPRLRLALGCCWAAQVITRDCSALGAVVAAPATSGVLTHEPQRSDFASRRAVALGLIACLHVGLIWMLATGLLQRMVPLPPPSMQASFVTSPLRPLQPPLPDPKFAHTIIEVPPLIADAFPPPTEDVIAATTMEPPAPPALTSVHAVSRVWGGPGHGFPSTEDFYPASAIRAGIEGGVTLRVCVDASGRLSGAPAIEQPSASALLDAAALKLAGAGSGHYRPTTDDGRAVSSCYPLRVRFQLR